MDADLQRGSADEDSEFQSWRDRLRENPNALLRGFELRQAERWLNASPHDRSEADERLIVAGVRRTKLIRWIAVGTIIFILGTLAATTWFVQGQRQSAKNAVEKARQDVARAVAVTAAGVFDKAPPLGLLLATESLNIAPNYDGERVLRSMLEQPWGIPLKGSGPSFSVSTVAISGNGRWIAATGSEGAATGSEEVVFLWDRQASNAQPLMLSAQGEGSPRSSVALSADGEWVVSGGFDGTVEI